jgi:hypothetical protein
MNRMIFASKGRMSPRPLTVRTTLMNRRITLAGLALLGATAAAALSSTIAPAAAAHAPVCVPGFATETNLSWLLKCQKTVPSAQARVAVTQANNANCTPNSYWNFGPKVTVAANPGRRTTTVTYICGHVEG